MASEVVKALNEMTTADNAIAAAERQRND